MGKFTAIALGALKKASGSDDLDRIMTNICHECTTCHVDCEHCRINQRYNELLDAWCDYEESAEPTTDEERARILRSFGYKVKSL